MRFSSRSSFARRVTVKDRVGRVRHVAFRLEAPEAPSRADLVDAIRAVATDALGRDGFEAMRPEVTAYAEAQGLLRVRHGHERAARDVLERVRFAGRAKAPLRIVPLGTSGTMRAARAKWLTGEAAVRRRARKGR